MVQDPSLLAPLWALSFCLLCGSSCLTLRWVCVFLRMGAQEARSCCFSDWGLLGGGGYLFSFRLQIPGEGELPS